MIAHLFRTRVGALLFGGVALDVSRMSASIGCWFIYGKWGFVGMTPT